MRNKQINRTLCFVERKYLSSKKGKMDFYFYRFKQKVPGIFIYTC